MTLEAPFGVEHLYCLSWVCEICNNHGQFTTIQKTTNCRKY